MHVSSNVGYEKPRIEIYEYARRTAGEPSVCYMIGDNPEADIRGGNEAGMKTILVHHTPGMGDNGADFVCETLSEIEEILLSSEREKSESR